MAEFPPPTENLSIFDYSQFMTVTGEGLTQGQADSLYLGRIGSATSIASDTSFSGVVNFNSLSAAPSCLSAPVAQTDLCNKSYVDSQAPLTAFNLFCNYSAAYGGYKLLDTNEVYTQSTLSFTTVNTTAVFVAGFFNSLTALNFGTSIPPGNWSLLCYANCASLADQSHIGLSFSIVGINGAGTETVLFSSVSSPLVSVVTPLFGCYSVTFSVPQTDVSSYVSLGIKIYAIGNDSVSRTGSIQFQKTGSYTSVLTSFAVQQSPNLISLDNIWTGTNSFNKDSVGALSSLNDATFHGVKMGRGNMNNESLLLGTGFIAGNGAATGTRNVIIGHSAGTALTTGGYNCILGNGAGAALTSGNNNTFLGDSSGTLTIGQSNNTCLGAGSKIAAGLAGSTAIGYNANCTTGTTVQIGASGANVNLGGSSSAVTCPGSLSVTGAITGNASTATSIAGGAAGDLLYQSSSGVTTKLGIGTAGYSLTSSGSVPQWSAVTLGTVMALGNAASAGLNMNTNTISGVSYLNVSGNTDISGSVTSGSLSTVGNANIGAYLTTGAITINTADPSLVSTTTAANLLIRSGEGRGIDLKTNGASGSITTIDATGAISCPSTLNTTGKITAPSISLSAADIIYDTVTASRLNIVNNTSGGSIFFKVNNAGTMTDTLNIDSTGIISTSSKQINMGSATLNGCSTVQSSNTAGTTTGLTLQNMANNTGALTISNNNLGSDIVIKTIESSTSNIRIAIRNANTLTLDYRGLVTITNAIQFGIGADITATISLPDVFKSIYYLATTSASQMVSLPNPLNHSGKQIMFRRKTGIQPVDFNYSGFTVMVPYNSVAATNTVSLLSTQFSTSFNSDGVRWYQMNTQ